LHRTSTGQLTITSTYSWLSTWKKESYMSNHYIADHHRPQDSQWDSRIAISCLLEILDLITRSDLKSDLIKELEKHTITLDVLKNNPNVDHQRLNDI